MAWKVKVEKRSGQQEKFDSQKIASSVFKAALRVGGKNRELSRQLAKKVEDYLKTNYPSRKTITSDEIGNSVEKILIEEGHAKTAKAFILYREGQRKARKKLIKLKDVPKLREFLKLTDHKIAFVTGVYDLLHVGHARYLKKASIHGDVLIVGLNSDSSANKLKEKNRPILGEEIRAEMLSYLDFVDYIVIYPWVHAAQLVKMLKPDIYVCVEGSWQGDFEKKPEVKIARRYKIEVIVLPLQSLEISTSKIVERIKNNSK